MSYAREDEARAGELARALEDQGYRVFWDREVPPGQTWHSYIGEALASARCVVVAWSRHSIASRWVIQEAGEGADRKVLIPVLLEEVQPPFGFRDIQAARLVDWRSGRASPAFEGLLGAVQRTVGGDAGSASGPEIPAGPRLAPAQTPHRRPDAWSRRKFLGALVGLFAVASGATLLWWLTQPGPTGPTAAPPAPAPAAGPSMAELKPSVHAQIFTHDAGLTEQDAARLKTHFESNGIPTAIYPHRDRRAPDAAFVGALVTAEKGQIALSAAPYDIRYLFPPDYSEIEGGDPSGFTIGLGYMSTHNEQFRKSEPVEVAESDLRKLLEPGISNVEFQRRLDHLYDRGIAAAPPAEATPRSRQP